MLQLRTIHPNTLGILKQIMALPVFAQHFLVGGTSLALQMGHRVSIDLDLFAHTPFDSSILLQVLKEHFQVQPLTITDTIFIAVVNGVKVDCVYFRYQFAFPIIEIEEVRLADMRDIAPMKLDAVTKRGSKKDFIDMYYLFMQYSPKQILQWYENMFQHSTSMHVILSLTYFQDAENTEMPILFDKSLTWEKIKQSIINTVQQSF